MALDVEQNLWKRVDKFLPVLGHVPFLRMVAVCNNLAFGKVNEKSDIDLFIIAEKGRLFTVRILTTFVLHLLGVRKHGAVGRFCLSFFVDDSSLNLSKIAIENDIYLAYWIKTLVPVLNDGVYRDFMRKNEWTTSYFEKSENYWKFIETRERFSEKRGEKVRRFLKRLLNGRLGASLEWILKKWQLRRELKKASKAGKESSIIVGEHILKFHYVDRRLEYREKWFKKYGVSAKLTKEKFSAL